MDAFSLLQRLQRPDLEDLDEDGETRPWRWVRDVARSA